MKIKNSNIIFLFATIALLLTSCTQKTNNDIIVLLESVNYTIPNENTVVLIIPVGGCSDCNKKAIEYVNSNIENPNLIVIASTIILKAINFKFKENIQQYENFIIDKNSFAIQLEIVSSGPAIYFFENGKLKENYKINRNNEDMIFNKIANFI